MTASTIKRPEALHVADLSRSVPFEFVRADGADGEADGLNFRGYAAVFGEPTVINSWEGCFREECAPGSFRKSLKERTPVFQFDHGTHPMVGSIPLGAMQEAREDDHGVLVDARLHDNWLVQPVRDAIASGAIDGMSFRFDVIRDRWTDPATGKRLTDPEEILDRIYHARPADDDLLLRTLLEVKSREMGPVVFPAYTGTSAEVRQITVDLTGPIDRETQGALARAVYAAEYVGTQDHPETPEDTSDEAVDHGTRDAPAAPQLTDESAETHPAETAPDPDVRASMQRQIARRAPALDQALKGAHRYE